MGRPKFGSYDTVKPQDNNFKKMRKSAKITQESLAREIGVAVSTVRRWEKSQCEPTMTIAQMRKLSEALKISFYSLPESFVN